MRKLLVALMMVAFAATAFAADVKFSGTYDVNGRQVSNYNTNDSSEYVNGVLVTGGNGSVTNSYYSHSFDVWMEAKEGQTTFKTMIELFDATVQPAAANAGDGDYDDAHETAIEVQRAWVGHNFGKVLLEAGLMGSGTWGYAFGDNAEGNFRVKGTFNVAGGKLHFFTQKNSEMTNSSNSTVDAEKDDADVYSLGYKGTFGGIMIAPKLDYVVNSYSSKLGGTDANDSKTIDFDLAVGGKFGALSVETEFQTKMLSYESEQTTAQSATPRKDYTTYGFYGNVGYNMGAATVGFLTAYASVSDDDASPKAYAFGDDFDALFVLDDALHVGNASDNGLAGFWANALYATYDVNEKLGLVAKLGYVTSNFDKASNAAGAGDHNYKDATAWEVDLAANYAITKSLKYYVNFGYAKVDLEQKTGETNAAFAARDIDDAIMLVKHGLTFSF